MAWMSAQRDVGCKAQDHPTVVLDENLPYGQALTGDWHVGVEGVLYDEMEWDDTAQMLFGDSETALMTDIAMVELWLTLVECDIVDGEGELLLATGMPYETFVVGLTAVWQHDPALFWDLHKVVREANPQWAPEGNE